MKDPKGWEFPTRSVFNFCRNADEIFRSTLIEVMFPKPSTAFTRELGSGTVGMVNGLCAIAPLKGDLPLLPPYAVMWASIELAPADSPRIVT